MKKNKKRMHLKDWNLYESEISVDISFTAFFTAIVLFFMGILLKSFSGEKYGILVELPILFLTISACGFLYSTLIYANATGKFILFKSKIFSKQIWAKRRFERCLTMGTTVSEYFGVYFLILSIPLAVNVLAENIFLKMVILFMVMGGLLFYHISGFCVMSRHFKRYHYAFLAVVVILEIILFIAQIFENATLAYFLTGILISFLFSLTVYIGLNSYKLIENLEKRK